MQTGPATEAVAKVVLLLGIVLGRLQPTENRLTLELPPLDLQLTAERMALDICS